MNIGIEDLIEEVCNANLLVRRDRPPTKVGEIELADATIASRRMTSGVVLQMGADCRTDLYEGARILFGEFTGAAVALEGVRSDSQVIFLADSDVYAVLSPGAIPRPEDALELPAEWLDEARARPAQLLIERAEMPLRRGKIYLPPGSKTHTRATEAVVRDVGAAVSGFVVGDRVQLAGQGGKRIAFGQRGERELWSVPPTNVLGKYREAPPETVILGERRVPESQEMLEAAFTDTPQTFDEGDRRGLR